ncbi:MAG: hypothetical protein WCV00_06845 [Verrucomicrobiia bacterium]|jgi:hypothetical protein
MRYDTGKKYDDPLSRYDQSDPPKPKPIKKGRIMASNKLPDKLDALVTLTEDAADGCHQLEVSVGLQHNKEADLRLDLGTFVTKAAGYDTVLSARVPLQSALTVARSNARGWLLMARDNFKTFLGSTPSNAWEAAGWSAESIAVPSTSDLILPLLQKVQGYLTANPAREVASMNLTAARAGVLHTALSDARAAANTQDDAIRAAKDERDVAEEALRTRMRNLIDELMQLLDPMSPHWLTFGLKRPGAPDSPAKVTNTRATAAGGGKVRVQCDPAARAEYYQIYQQLPDEEDFTLADSPPMPDETLEGYTVGATVKFKMRAVNETGTGRFGDEVSATVT